jgi:mitochondrial fission protein ELM1
MDVARKERPAAPRPESPATATRRIWALTTGEAGMRMQARALAEALAEIPGGTVTEKVVALREPWARLPAGMPGLLLGLDPASDPLTPPWPDLVISCGRRSGAVALALKRRAGPSLRLVHVQDPRARAERFDLVIAMAHDKAAGPNVVKIATALNTVTPERLSEAGRAWAPRLSGLPRPLTAVLLGGPAGWRPFTPGDAARLQAGLSRLKVQENGGLLVIPSRRTPQAAVDILAAAWPDDPAVSVWRRTGDNPYLGALALADRLVVTSDSVSMISEALATPHAVEVFVHNLRPQHGAFVNGLVEHGLVRLFDGQAARLRPRAPLNATAEAAQAVRRMLDPDSDFRSNRSEV